MGKEISVFLVFQATRVQPLRRVRGKDLKQHGEEAVMVPGAAQEQSQGKEQAFWLGWL